MLNSVIHTLLAQAHHAPPANTSPSADSFGALPAWTVFVFLVLMGVLIGAGCIALVLRDRRDKWALLKSIGAGTITSSLLAALGTRIGGVRSVDLTWIEAGILSGLGFCVGTGSIWGRSSKLH